MEATITDDTALVSLMHVNNEIGVINPIKEIGRVCHGHSVPFHSVTVQSAGKLPLDVNEINLDFLSMSGHKFYGPKGVGLLFIRHATPWMPWMHGGSQEHRRRGGTLNVPGIVGMAKALDLMEEDRKSHWKHYKKLRKKLINGLQNRFPGMVSFNGTQNSVPYIINLSITGEDG